MNYIRFWQANDESQKISARVKSRLNQMTLEGKFTGGVASFGYKLIKSGEINKKGKELMDIVIDEDEASIVKKIFEMTVKEGYGSYRMADYLNSHGIRTHNNSKLQCNTVNRILKNRLYCGYLVSGGVVQSQFGRDVLGVVRLDETRRHKAKEKEILADISDDTDKETMKSLKQ